MKKKDYLFKKGQSGNPNGRPKGKPNKITTDLRRIVSDLVESNLDNIQDLLSKLPPDRQLHYIIQLFEFALPKLSRVESTGLEGDAMNFTLIVKQPNDTETGDSQSGILPDSDQQG
tara:strand:- start:533 stop:880 length:348 start_codon:yes stop_codon:yes gene_type:complete